MNISDPIVRAVPRWYLIHAKPSAEAIAQENLQRQDYEIYLPRLLHSVRRGGRTRERVVALFPRYLFLRLNEGLQSLGPVRSSLGVTDVVRFGFSYAIIPDRVIHDLRAREDSNSGLHRLTTVPYLVAGMEIKVTTGPFNGLEGVFQCEVGNDRVDVLLNLLGRDTSIRIPADSILPSCAA